jgi:hypothetical protein
VDDLLGSSRWYDALCINQRDIKERSQQVTMMGDLYRNGIRNLIYLGEEDVEPAMKGIEAILNEARADSEGFARLRNDAGAWQYSSIGIVVEYDSAALLEFFNIPWFRYVCTLFCLLLQLTDNWTADCGCYRKPP